MSTREPTSWQAINAEEEKKEKEGEKENELWKLNFCLGFRRGV